MKEMTGNKFCLREDKSTPKSGYKTTIRSGAQFCGCTLIVLALCGLIRADEKEKNESGPEWMQSGIFHWNSSEPLLGADPMAAEPEVALKDPSIVRVDNQWHLFATHRLFSGKVDMQYVRFADWKDAKHATRYPMTFQDAYHCAPQVFYFTPHKKWYLVYQAANAWTHPESTLPEHFTLAPVFSCTDNLADPYSWTKPERMVVAHEGNRSKPRWIDFWVICDLAKAHLFFTSDDGNFWRSETKIVDFPQGWSQPELVMKDTKEELFEASHTYKLKGHEKYLTIIEAIGNSRRYYKTWIANQLEGPWQPLAATQQKPFADAVSNVAQMPVWTTSISHGELIRSGFDQYMEIDPNHLQFLYQGVDEAGYRGNKYGGIPWKLGLLELVESPARAK